MRRNRIWIALLLAAVSGVAAGYLALNFFQRTSIVPTPAVASTTSIAVAARDLAVGTVIGPEDVELLGWPSGGLPQGYASSKEEVLGRGVITRVSAREPLLTTKLSTKEAGGGLPIVIPEGMRALSVETNQVIGVAGFILPETRVDVLLTINPSGGEPPTTKVILQNVEVLTAGQMIQRDAEGQPQKVSVVTLLLTPEDAEKLTLATSEGRIHFALRNTLDTAEIETAGVERDDLLGRAPAPRPAPVRRRVAAPQQPRYGVEVFNGAERSVATF